MTIISEKKRCLILSCSRAKHGAPELLPAVQRYTGPMYQVLRRYLREKPEESNHLSVYILSARYGLIESQTPIPSYDQKMTPTRAVELRPDVLNMAQQVIAPIGYGEIYLAMGQTYLSAMDGLAGLLNGSTRLIVSQDSSGKQLTALRNWLWGSDEKPALPLIEQEVMANVGRVTAILRGHTRSFTTAEVMKKLESGLLASPDSAQQIRGWYVIIAEARVSPKWAAQHLFGVPVSEFSADEARRVLRKLGFNCYRV